LAEPPPPPPPAPAAHDRRSLPVCASSCPRSLPSLSLAAQWGRPVGAKLICARMLSLAVPWATLVSPSTHSVVRFRWHVGPTGQNRLPRPNRPHLAMDAPMSRVSWPPLHAPDLLLVSHPTHTLPSLSCAPSRTPSPSLTLRARRGLAPVLRSSSSPRRARCLGEFHLVVNNTRHPTLTGDLPVQSELRHRRPEASLRLRRCSGAPMFPLEVSSLPAPYFSVYFLGLSAIARWSRSAPPLGHPTAFCTLRCPYTGVVPTVEFAMSP
jgi:hypothetical protein